MWLATKYGFFSIVQTRENKDLFMVRARAEKDLQNLKNSLSMLKEHEIKITKQADYHFRLLVNRKELSRLMQFFATEIDYPNFKDKVYTVANQKDKLPFYHEIWGIMYNYQK
jgi:hypothetical protein